MALGVAGILQREKNRTFAIVGTVLSVGTALVLVSLALYGTERVP